MKNTKKIVLNIMLVVCVIVFVYSGFHLFNIYKNNYDEKTEIDGIKEVIGVPKADDTKNLTKFSVDFEALRQTNPDIVAWVVVENTSISYPVVQGSDNDYYLDHTFEKKENYAGSIFLDYRVNSDFTSKNSFVYGHNVLHGTMFAELENYTEKSYFDEHPYIYLYTPDGNYKLEVFSAYIDLASSDSYQMNFNSDAEYLSYLDYIIEKSVHQREGMTINAQDNIVTLYTCSYESGQNPDNTDAEYINDRYFIHAKIIEDL